MGFTCGLVGLPNAGKSTLFNAVTKSSVPAEAFPFCTIEPHTGVVAVPDPRLTKIAGYFDPKKITPTTLELVDIAGLVKGASQGEGLGNQFLGQIRQVEAIALVLRCFEDEDVAHVDGTVDPVRDYETLMTELVLADLGTVDRRLEKSIKAARGGDKAVNNEVEALKTLQAHLNQGLEAATSEAQSPPDLPLLTSKPAFIVANLDEDSLPAGEGNAHLKALSQLAKDKNLPLVHLAARLESEVAALDESDVKEFLEAYSLKEPGLNKLIRLGYDLLGLLTFFTAGKPEARAWTVNKGATAVESAGKIHSDIARGFIRAEIYHCDDLFELESENAVREAGRLRLEGKDYVMQDGDVCYFRFNV